MTLPPEKLQEMRDARRAALVAKWSAGARLSNDEREEIADLIGAKPMAVAEVPAPPFAATVSPVGPALVLEATPAGAFSSRSGCRHHLVDGCEYETTFDVGIRQIKRWREKGAAQQPPSYPPLDEPWRMAEWYRRVMRRRVPQRLEELEAAGAPTPTPPGSKSPRESTTAPAPRIPALPSSPVAATLATGYAATLDRLSQAEAIAAQRYADAVASADPDVRAQATALKREWVDLADTVRAYERDRGKVLRESDAIWDKTAVLEAISSVHNVIAPGVRRLWRTIRRRHPQFHALTSSQQDEVFAREVDVLFGVLGNTRFTATTLPARDLTAAPGIDASETATAPTPAEPAPQLAA